MNIDSFHLNHIYGILYSLCHINIIVWKSVFFLFHDSQLLLLWEKTERTAGRLKRWRKESANYFLFLLFSTSVLKKLLLKIFFFQLRHWYWGSEKFWSTFNIKEQWQFVSERKPLHESLIQVLQHERLQLTASRNCPTFKMTVTMLSLLDFHILLLKQIKSLVIS